MSPRQKEGKNEGQREKCALKNGVQHTATGTLKGTPKARWVEEAVTRPHV